MFTIKIVNADNVVKREYNDITPKDATIHTDINQFELLIVKSVVITYLDDSRCEVINNEVA